MWFFSDHPRDSGVMREESDANLSRKFFFTNFALTWSNHRSAWAISGVVSWSEVELQLNYCMKLSEWLRPAGLPAVIITVLKSKAKLEKRLITGDNDGHYDKLCLFQFWRGAHVLLSTRGLIKYVLLTNRGWFIFNKIPNFLFLLSVPFLKINNAASRDFLSIMFLSWNYFKILTFSVWEREEQNR